MTWHPHLGNVHGVSLAEWLGSLPPAPPIRNSIVIATGERTGSEWLCQLLGATGRLGRPMEYFNPFWNMRFIPDYPHDIAAIVDVAHRAGVTANGTFSSKLHTEHFDRLKLSVRLIDVFPNPVFVWLHRRDRLGQAISLVRAQQSKRYHEHWRERGIETYNAQLIDQTMTELIRSASRWENYFCRNGVNPLKISYEDLQANPVAAVQSIAKLVGESIKAEDIDSRKELKVQRDHVSAAWRERFLAEACNLDRFD